MKMMKKAASLLLTMIFIFATFMLSGISVNAQLISDYCTVSDGGKVIWTFDTNTGTLTFSGTGTVDTPDGNFGTSQPWAVYEESITQVVIEDGVDFEMLAFKNCRYASVMVINNDVGGISGFSLNARSNPYLSSISVPASSPYYTSIDDVLFEKDWISNSDELTLECYPPQKSDSSYEIPRNTTSIGSWAFYGCENLNYITIPSSVTNISQEAFVGTGYYNNPSNWENGVLYIGDCLIKVDKNYQGTLYIREGTRLIARNALQESTGITNVITPESLEYINPQGLRKADFPHLWESGALYLGSCLVDVDYETYYSANGNSFTIKEGTTMIAEDAFSVCKFNTITIPKSVASINGDYRHFGETKTINYEGTINEWSKILMSAHQFSDITINCTDGVYSDAILEEPVEADYTWEIVTILLYALVVLIVAAVVAFHIVEKKKKNKKTKESIKEKDVF